MHEGQWYDELRSAWRPSSVRLLVIGESAPDDHGDVARRRFFYADALGPDNLFRGVAAAMFGTTAAELAKYGKRPVLELMRDAGLYLIDLAPVPVNASQAHKRRELRSFAEDCVRRAAAARPEGVVIVKANVFALLDHPLRAAGLNVLHDQPIPFPLGNWRSDFVVGFRAACAGLDGFPTGEESSVPDAVDA